MDLDLTDRVARGDDWDAIEEMATSKYCAAMDAEQARVSAAVREAHSRGRYPSMGIDWSSIPVFYIVGGYALAKVVGPMAEALGTKLGERLGQSLAESTSRVRMEFTRSPGHYQLFVKGPNGRVRMLVDPDLPDDAKIALLEFDFGDAAHAGKTFTWDEASNEWVENQASWFPWVSKHL
ncbi:hypothetical protein [Streptomyces alboniger]|uniref:Uncharacterized protein n=1 Tax=Streptomyces alboniger TaxID=132473 RepID=A0A5J6HG95_STRAD|nr:hypothetical protein [Streptomyces alboniger]QEV16217.1 hypothetical protein CP975_00675 [Streptomyces alboniger]